MVVVVVVYGFLVLILKSMMLPLLLKFPIGGKGSDYSWLEFACEDSKTLKTKWLWVSEWVHNIEVITSLFLLVLPAGPSLSILGETSKRRHVLRVPKIVSTRASWYHQRYARLCHWLSALGKELLKVIWKWSLAKYIHDMVEGRSPNSLSQLNKVTSRLTLENYNISSNWTTRSEL